MSDMNEPQNTLRDVLESQFDALESAPAEKQTTEQVEQPAESRARDEQGRFAPKTEKEEAQPATAPVPAPPTQAAPQTTEQQAPPRLTTWRKEYLPIQEKLAQGVPLTLEEAKKLAEYNVQREKEYATGISTYKSEAQSAKELQSAMAEFMPTLQQHNIQPAVWIQNLGRAHQTLALGSPEQKLQMFMRLAQDYGVPLGAVQQAQGGQLDPIVPQLMAQIQSLQQGVNNFSSWKQQQEEQAARQELAKFQDETKYPYFEQVRQTMGQLLESGLAPNPETAYEKAVRMHDDVWQAEQERQAQAQAAQAAQAKAAAVQQAKAKAVSPRSTTPTGQVTTAEAKDRRSLLAEALDSVASGRV